MRGFDFLAPVYDKLAQFIFGNAIKNATTAHLDRIEDGDKVLILGGGTGWILEKLPQMNIEVAYVELSQKMLLKAKSRKINYKVSFIYGSYTDVPDEVYDIIITPFFLDLFTTGHSEKIVSLLRNKLRKSGFWINVDFTLTSILWQKAMIYIMYRFFRFCCNIEATRLPDYKRIFKKFNKKAEQHFYHGMLISTVYRKSNSVSVEVEA